MSIQLQGGDSQWLSNCSEGDSQGLSNCSEGDSQGLSSNREGIVSVRPTAGRG